MTEIFANTYRSPDEGDIIKLPDDATTDIERVGSRTRPDVILEVVGSPETSEYVALYDGADGLVDVPDGSKVLGIDPWHERVWYAVPREVYNQ